VQHTVGKKDKRQKDIKHYELLTNLSNTVIIPTGR